ncbi:MAG: hypothetical protein JXA14_21460 [Anaerolineae bacterium]|nr:hypothetical protein [Anaerolineae bacterium]
MNAKGLPNHAHSQGFKGARCLFAAALLAVLANLIVSPPVAYALTFDVDRVDDNPAANACTAAPNDCSLRGAIDRANANSGLDVINLPGLAFLLDINTPSPDEDANLLGDLDILDDVTIKGNGAIVRGGGLYRVFHVVTPGITVSMNDIQIENGAAGADYGGGIRNNGGNLTLTDSVVTHNNANRGGGIYTSGGSLILDNTDLDDSDGHGNTAITAGGGIYSSGTTVTLTNGCVISYNDAGTGGGIYNTGDGMVTLENGSILNNQAGDNGGGIYNEGLAT